MDSLSLLLNKYIKFDACPGLAVGGPIAVRLFQTNTGAQKSTIRARPDEAGHREIKVRFIFG